MSEIWSIGNSASADYLSFSSPQGIALDSSGNIYVADLGNSRIKKYDANGNFLTMWGSFGSTDGKFNEPIAIAVDSSNNIYVVDKKNNRIQKFGP